MVRNTGTKVKIAGAGPAGLTAAICLAKAGVAVDVYEAKEAVGARFIGDFQVLENGSGYPDPLELLQKLGIAINFFVRPIYEATLFDYRLHHETVSSVSPFSYLIRRGRRNGLGAPNPAHGIVSLDEGLRDQALFSGVSIHYQTRVKPNEVDIVATGPAAADGLAKEMTFLTDRPDTVWVLFDMKYSPGGYAYLFVSEGMATFGCAITRDLSQINRYFEAALARFQEIAPFTIRDEETGYSFMDFSLKPSASHDQRLYIGEAGGFQDYLFGLGLRYAFMTGYFAATSFMDRGGDTTPARYDLLWKEGFGLSQEISLVNRSLYEWGGNVGLARFIRMAAKKDFKEYLTSWQIASPWKRMLVPIIKRIWQKDPSGEGCPSCRHLLPVHWCRRESIRKGPL